MGAGDSPKYPPDKEKEARPPPSSPAVVERECFSDVRLADAPILLLICFHEALREELADLHHLAVTASERGSHGRELIVELRRRFDFLKLAYKYHCAAEDEVIFLELDVHVKNVVQTYSLEHESIDDLFDSVFHWLNELEENNKCSKPFEELAFCIGTMQSSICKHMLKEEEQVFPLLVQQFSPGEQASLVWQFICSVPVILLEDFLPWMFSFLSPEKQVDVTHCIVAILPKEKSLQEVMVSWLHRNDQSSSRDFTKIRKGAPDGSSSMKLKSEQQLHSSKRPLGEIQQWKKKYCVQTNVGNNPVDFLHLWHGAILKDLKEILEESYQIRSSSSFLNIDSIGVRLKFLADVVIFYRNALKKFFYPVLNELATIHFCSLSSEESSIESRMQSLHQLLYHNVQNGLPLCKFVEKLCRELESFVMDISKQFYFEETEVFPVISKNCSHETQQQLLYTSLHVMPLGLLKCVISWFAAYLSKNETRSILHIMNQGDFLADKSFASLLLEWFHIGYSGKTSTQNFGKDLQKMFKSRSSFLPEHIKEVFGCSSLHLNVQPCQQSYPNKLESVSANKNNKFLSCSSSSGPHKAKMYETSYSSEINLRVFFPEAIRTLHPFPKLPGEESSGTSVVNKPIPMDLIFFFHKALKKDLEYLVSCSAKLAENVGFLMEFRQRFHLLQFRYQFHSDTEDEIAFPALEAKEKVQNISHSYTIDHKLEAKHFSEISLILDEMSKLQILVSSVDSNTEDQRMVKHNQLCMKLHHTCKSMQKLLSDHVLREEIELWPLFRECFSIPEQENIIGRMLGRIRAETLQDMISWLISSLTPEEQHAMMSLWRKVTMNTMFDEWLGEWWEGYDAGYVAEELNTSCIANPLEIISRYLPKESFDKQGDILCDTGIEFSQKDCFGANAEKLGKYSLDDKAKGFIGDQNNNDCSECTKLLSKGDKKRCNEGVDVTDKIDKPGQTFQLTLKSRYHEQLLTMSQDDLQAAIRKVSRDSSLDPQRKSYIIQNLLMSRWIVQQQISHMERTISSDGEDIPGQHPSYWDPLKQVLGCKHYKRNCKLVTACCNQLYTCIRCHDEVADHSTDRRAIKKMMCMKCLVIQPIGQTCSTASCNNLSMATYYCRICKLFDDEREIYHCPYCNLCRLGKGLGIDYFHCMKCNACMSPTLSVHICREKCLEDNCPICHEYIFTSSTPVKALHCGHLMHSTCFQDYTLTHYTCPICSKSLGDMQVYFKMLDVLLAEEKIPDEYSGQTQDILCNDCEKKGAAPFHWLYHKCSYCSSYNTRLL